MRHHDGPAQVALDGEVTERRLRERAEKDDEGEPLRTSWQRRYTTRAEPGQERDEDDDASDNAVTELDVRVVVLRRQRMPAFAPGPVAAAKPGIGEPHRGAGADDDPQGEQLRRGERREPRRRQRERADACDRRRLDAHVPSVERWRRKPPPLDKRVEDRRVAVGPVERRRARAEEER